MQFEQIISVVRYTVENKGNLNVAAISFDATDHQKLTSLVLPLCRHCAAASWFWQLIARTATPSVLQEYL